MAITRATVEGWYVNGMLTNKAQIDMLWERLQQEQVNKVYQVSVNSEDTLEGEWLRNLIVIAPDEETAREDAEREVRDWGETVMDGTETYALGTERQRVVGLLVGDDER